MDHTTSTCSFEHKHFCEHVIHAHWTQFSRFFFCFAPHLHCLTCKLCQNLLLSFRKEIRKNVRLGKPGQCNKLRYSTNYHCKFLFMSFGSFCWLRRNMIQPSSGRVNFNHIGPQEHSYHSCIQIACFQNVLQNTNEYILRYLHDLLKLNSFY